MPDSLGFSVYLSTFRQQQSLLLSRKGKETPVFLSLHMGEEFGPDYCRQAKEVCLWLSDQGFRIIADVSIKTQQQFGEPDLIRLAESLRLWALRIDYGLTEDEILSLARQIPVVLNASTVTPDAAARIVKAGRHVMAMHNFYPRPETGLDSEYLLSSTRHLQEAGVKVLAFIPGDTLFRGPVYEGLPTLEHHRGMLPSAAFGELKLRYGMDGIFVGDPGISQRELSRITDFCEQGILSVPAALAPEHEGLYGRVFTCRPDSPSWLVRLAESRTYSCPGDTVIPRGCVPRVRGSITMDNQTYGRYSGEIQLIRRDLPQDSRVNVIGRVPENALPLADCIERGAKFRFVREETI